MKNDLNFNNKNKKFNSNKLYVGNIQCVSLLDNNQVLKETKEKYLFEEVSDNLYKEVFTGKYFENEYNTGDVMIITNLDKLRNILDTSLFLDKYDLLFILDEVNHIKRRKRIK